LLSLGHLGYREHLNQIPTVSEMAWSYNHDHETQRGPMSKVSIPGSLAVVTGAGSGIGRATAKALAAEGATVLCVDINEVAAKETATALGGKAAAYTADVSDLAALEALAAAIASEHGVPDIVVNNAGIGMSGSFLETTAADWDAIIGVNQRGVINGCAAFGPAMVARGSGQVINVASGLGFIPTPATPAYCTTKAAVLQLSRCLRADWAGLGVGVTAICPGFINTPIAQNTHYLGAGSEKARQLSEKGFSRAHPPESVAKAIVSSIKRNRSVVPTGFESWAGWYLVRVLPTPLLDVVGSVIARGARRQGI
jgi:NAD(P)-dependent dehydrogenase (short-subunit alcohol dehydrogenase family)